MSEDCIPEARSMTPSLVLTGAGLALDAFGNVGPPIEGLPWQANLILMLLSLFPDRLLDE